MTSLPSLRSAFLWSWFSAVLLSVPCSAENWPGFRGPTGQGISSEGSLPLTWSLTENLAWRVDVPGIGWSSPVVWQDRVNEYFLAGVTAGRSMLTAARVRELADGRAYLAAEAKALGLIDAIGSFDQALAAGATLAQAQTAWMTEQNKRLAAAQQRPGVEAVGTKLAGKGSQGIDPDAVSNWNALVEAEQQTGKSLAQATRACVLKHGDAHLAYLAAFNAGVPRD